MFYNLSTWTPFGWDQVDNAWAAWHIIILHTYPLVGMVAKGNTGIYIGPLYYYFVSVFYFFTHMDPIASPIIAGVTSLISFGVIYVVGKKLFDERLALVSLSIYTFSSFIITTERIQWPVNFIAPLSLLILYFLYKVISGDSKYFLLVGGVVGLSFHIHFTAVFYPLIILAALPFVRWNRKTLFYFVCAIGIVAIFFIPQAVYYLQRSHTQALSGYLETSYHGLHLRRVLQIAPDAFIKFQSLLMTPYWFVKYVSFLFVPVFLALYRKKVSYLIALWFLIPWIVFATYSGEMSDYYFSLESYLTIIILAYLTIRVWNVRNVVPKALIGIFWLYWTVTNIQTFIQTHQGDLAKNRAEALNASMTARIIPFTEGDPQSYLYYYYMYRRGGWLPYKL